MSRFSYQGTFKDGNGRVVTSGTISVFLNGTSTVASVYTASSGGSAVNSVTSDSTDGSFIFYVDDGDYITSQLFKITLAKTDYQSTSYDDIAIFQQVSLAGAETFSGIKTFSAAPVLNGTAWPSFSVHKGSSNQTGIVQNTWTKVTWSTEEFDTNNDFASNKFTPTVAGKYQLNLTLELTAIIDQSNLQVSIYKNGTIHKKSGINTSSGTGAIGVNFSVIVDANGSSDYFEAFIHQSDPTSRTIDGAAITTHFSGCRIG